MLSPMTGQPPACAERPYFSVVCLLNRANQRWESLCRMLRPEPVSEARARSASRQRIGTIQAGGTVVLLACSRHDVKGRPARTPTKVLCHELVHSIRQMRGVMQCVGRGDIYATHEEFCAVEVANVYASCRGRPIAGDYWHSTVREGLVSPFGEQTARQRDEDRWIERMRTEQPGFVYALSRISRESASYNPFRPRSPYVRYVNRPY